jgi:hypothetical protein
MPEQKKENQKENYESTKSESAPCPRSAAVITVSSTAENKDYEDNKDYLHSVSPLALGFWHRPLRPLRSFLNARLIAGG